MGIPAYFSHIIKNHSTILKNPKTTTIDNLYIDSNSIIYDIIHSLNEIHDFNHIYDLICKKIKFYIQEIKPKSITYIAFDGVAPIAKLDQQRKRGQEQEEEQGHEPEPEPEREQDQQQGYEKEKAKEQEKEKRKKTKGTRERKHRNKKGRQTVRGDW